MQQSIENCPVNMPLATLSAFHDHALPADLAEQVQQHIASCSPCQAALTEYSVAGQAIRQFDAPQMQDAIWGDVHQETLHATPRRPLTSQRRLVLGSLSAALVVVLVFAVIAVTQLGQHGSPTTLAPAPTSTSTAISTMDATATVAENPTTVLTSTTLPVVATATDLPQPTATPKAVVSMKEVSQSLAITDSSVTDYAVSVSCPTGQTMLGGGYSIVGDSNAQKALLLASYPSTANTWTVAETNPAGGAMTLSAYADCLTSNIPFTTEIDLSSGGSAPCSANAVVTGGGFKQDHAGASLIVLDGHTGGNWWMARQSQPSGSLVEYAICIAPNRFTTNEAISLITLSGGATGNATAICPSGQIVTGGGYGSYDSAELNYIHVLSNHVSSAGDRWTITVTNIGPPGYGTTSDVQCLIITS